MSNGGLFADVPKECADCTFYAHPELMTIHMTAYHGAVQPPTQQMKDDAHAAILAIGFNEQQATDIIASMDDHNA